MTILALIGHLLNFMAPALVMACLLWGLPRLRRASRQQLVRRWAARTEWLALLGVGVAVLLAGLVFFGRDGKMVTYAALVLAQGTLAWWVRWGQAGRR